MAAAVRDSGFTRRSSILPQSDPLKIACVIHSLCGGGSERVMAALASHLAERGHAVTLINFDDGASDRHRVLPSVRRTFLRIDHRARSPLGKLVQIRRRHQQIRQAITDSGAEVVLSFCDRNNVDVLLSVPATGPPVVVSERSDPGQQTLGAFWDWMRRRVYPRAEVVVALTQHAADTLREFCDTVAVIPSAIEPPTLRSDREMATASKIIAAAGRLEFEKGFDRLIEAFAIATSQRSDWQLVIYGDGSLRDDLLEQADALGVGGRVSLPGWIRPLEPSLAGATLFCLPSRYEGFPSALLEAMALGVPSLSVDCESGPREIIEHGLNGYLVEPSVEGLADGIRKMIDDPNQREQLGREAIRIIDRFDMEAMVERYETLLSQAAAANRR